MKYRRLRIAWSVWWGILAASLIALWARSYWSVDTFYSNIFGFAFKTQSVKGSLELIRNPNGPWGISTMSLDDWMKRRKAQQALMRYVYQRTNTPPVVRVFASVPHWLAALSLAIFATAPWLGWSKRFGLRTLLIATTLIAIVLGIVVWTARQ
jgi:hypothetical protein